MIIIRKATTSDAPIIADIGKRSFIESHGHSASAADIDSYVSRKYTLHAVQQELEDPANNYHLISFNGQPAGYSKIILDAANENLPDRHITCLDRLYLLRDFYDLMLGAKLLQFNIDLSKQAGQTGMWLYTWTENKRAITFYHKAGFRIIGAANFSISPTHANPNHVMYLDYAAP